MPSTTAMLSGNNFISSMPLDNFDDSFKGAIDVDFERDFGQWFNPENDVNDMSGLGEK
ncbi:hypothetical protein FIBSPDRAFT_871051 [Athelia psychrophila]|uniref:Uncharacterized protein n=1 Tax=Athelia psychrophila TaxID=1759441 RepID=A0A166AJ17_9AGAM|nr:hypothetical protein FIBSPDRAFT_871051 [Fibularhizoctonia sp. CBS 109695]